MISSRTGLTKTIVVAVGLFLLAGAAQADIIDVTTPGDTIVGLHNTIAGGANTVSTPGTGSGQYPTNEPPANAINNSADQKYLNFGGIGSSGPGENTGFYVTPSAGASIVTGLRFATANDSPNRDPMTFTLEGTNEDPATTANWTLIASGSTGLEDMEGVYKTWQDPADQPSFANSAGYTSYRLLFPTVRGTGQNSMQFGEVELLGIVPEPATMGLLALGGLAALTRRRRTR